MYVGPITLLWNRAVPFRYIFWHYIFIEIMQFNVLLACNNVKFETFS